MAWWLDGLMARLRDCVIARTNARSCAPTRAHARPCADPCGKRAAPAARAHPTPCAATRGASQAEKKSLANATVTAMRELVVKQRRGSVDAMSGLDVVPQRDDGSVWIAPRASGLGGQSEPNGDDEGKPQGEWEDALVGCLWGCDQKGVLLGLLRDKDT
eukprot:1917737-Prymnesium_polylepis.1